MRKPVRDAEGRLIGFNEETTDGSRAYDAEGRYLGRTSHTFSTTRDHRGRLVSVNTGDPNLLHVIGGDDE